MIGIVHLWLIFLDAKYIRLRAWQSRPLDAVYPILYLDALQVKVKS